MADNCFICKKSVSTGETVIVDGGLQTLKDASYERDDGLIEFLNSVNVVTIHVQCRKEYTRKTSILAFKRHREENAAGSQPSPRKRRMGDFNFQRLCFICCEIAEVDIKQPVKYRRKIKQVSTNYFKEYIIKKAELRNDRLGKIVKDRINSETDLIAADAKYHGTCLAKFTVAYVGRKLGRPLDEKVRISMDEIFNYIENNDDCQFTLKQLEKVPEDFLPDSKTIISKLIEHYGKNITITTKHAKLTIICFRDTEANILSNTKIKNLIPLKNVYEFYKLQQ